jgi:hypothetical protein
MAQMFIKHCYQTNEWQDFRNVNSKHTFLYRCFLKINL